MQFNVHFGLYDDANGNDNDDDDVDIYEDGEFYDNYDDVDNYDHEEFYDNYDDVDKYEDGEFYDNYDDEEFYDNYDDVDNYDDRNYEFTNHFREFMLHIFARFLEFLSNPCKLICEFLTFILGFLDQFCILRIRWDLGNEERFGERGVICGKGWYDGLSMEFYNIIE